MGDSQIIFLWCHLRSISTAFERAFIQRNDFFPIHEPYSEAFYVGPERLTKRYPENYGDEQKHAKITYAQTTAQIIATAEKHKGQRIFCKDMALYIIRPDPEKHPENPTILDLNFLKRCAHTFLLRSPEKSIPSLYRCYKDVEHNLDFNDQEAGFVELRILYNFLTKLNEKHQVPLVDSADLVRNPLDTMKKYCEIIGISFEPGMMAWKAEKVEAFEKWREYHKDAENSTGISEIARDNNEKFPDSVYEAIRKNMGIYNELRQYKI